MVNKKEILQSILKLAAIVLAATILGKIFTELGFPETNIVVMYLLAVLLVARFTSGYQYGILSAVVSLICYNYFFTEPFLRYCKVLQPYFSLKLCIFKGFTTFCI